jgi:hypothetical protein
VDIALADPGKGIRTVEQPLSHGSSRRRLQTANITHVEDTVQVNSTVASFGQFAYLHQFDLP